MTCLHKVQASPDTQSHSAGLLQQSGWFSPLLAFTGGGESATVNGFLWLAGAIAFAVSGGFISRSPDSSNADTAED